MFVSHLVRTLGTQLAKWWWWTWCMCAAISLVEIRGKLAACCPHVISVTLDKNNISGCAQPIYYNRLHSGWSTLMKVKKQELVKSLCCCLTLNWCDQRQDGAKCWKLLKKENARMISLPPPPILKVIHRSHHSRCGEEILGSHTGAPTATQGAPTGYKARDIHTVEELRINRGTTARQIYIRSTTATQKYISQPRSLTGLHAEPAEPHKAKAHHKKSQRSKGRDRNAKSHSRKTVELWQVVFAHELRWKMHTSGCGLWQGVFASVHIEVWAFPLFPVCIHCLAGVQLKVEAI